VTETAGRTVADLLDEAQRRLRVAQVPDPRREAFALLALVLGTDRGGVVASKPDTADDGAAQRLAELLDARERRVPLQHLAGVSEFRGLEFEVCPDVLIPRPETEGLVDAVLDAGLPASAHLADLGTGSGCIAVALAVERPSWRVAAVDASCEALRVASRNVDKHGVADRVTLIERDFGRVPDGERGRFDAVVSNPPYVPEEEWRGLQPEVRDNEPRIALVPGPTGNEGYEAVAKAAGQMLRPGGLLALELGWKSEEAVRAIVLRDGFRDIVVSADLQGIPRVLTARR
jgi:release factor glutamine methyltransferase